MRLNTLMIGMLTALARAGGRKRTSARSAARTRGAGSVARASVEAPAGSPTLSLLPLIR